MKFHMNVLTKSKSSHKEPPSQDAHQESAREEEEELIKPLIIKED